MKKISSQKEFNFFKVNFPMRPELVSSIAFCLLGTPY